MTTEKAKAKLVRWKRGWRSKVVRTHFKGLGGAGESGEVVDLSKSSSNGANSIVVLGVQGQAGDLNIVNPTYPVSAVVSLQRKLECLRKGSGRADGHEWSRSLDCSGSWGKDRIEQENRQLRK